MIPEGKIIFIIDSRLEYVQLVDTAIRHLCETANSIPDECDLIQLSVAEAINNAIKHGCKTQTGHDVEVTMEFNTDWFIFSVTSIGEFFKIRTGEAPDLAPGVFDRIPENGYGLFLIENIMDEVKTEFKDGKSKITMRKARTKGKTG